MPVMIKDTIHKMCIALAHLWFWNSDSDWASFWVYPKHLETHHERLTGKRIRVTIEMEGDPNAGRGVTQIFQIHYKERPDQWG